VTNNSTNLTEQCPDFEAITESEKNAFAGIHSDCSTSYRTFISLDKAKVRECLLSFGAESVVLKAAIQKLKDQDIQNYNFARSFVWMWNLVADIEGGTQAEGVWE